MPFPVCPSTKMPILCSGMIAASLAAPTGAQHCPPRALRGASGSSAPGNRLPQPTTQPAAVHAAGNCPPCNLPPWRYRRHAYPSDILPAAHTTVHTPGQPTCRSYRRPYPRTTYPPGILPRDGSSAQRAGDSDVGANDKGAGDDPGDWVDAH